MTDERIISSSLRPEDLPGEAGIRPMTLADYTGQDRVKNQMSIYIEAAKKRGFCPGSRSALRTTGLGKTTLANIIANEMDVHIRTTSGPAIERAGDLAAILTSLEPHDVLLCRRDSSFKPFCGEILYPAWRISALISLLGKVLPLVLCGWTFPPLLWSAPQPERGCFHLPCGDRFGVISRLDYYNTDDLKIILQRAAAIMGVPLTNEGADEIARRSRGTPRIANRLLRRVRDFAEVKADGELTAKWLCKALLCWR